MYHVLQSEVLALPGLIERLEQSPYCSSLHHRSLDYDIVHFGSNCQARMNLLLVSFPKGLVLIELDIYLYIRHYLSNSPMWNLD